MSQAPNQKKVAVIVAGGMGHRMGAGRPKQFLELGGQPILVRTLKTFLASYIDLEIVLVLPRTHLSEGQKLINEFVRSDRIQIVEGGETRFHSVQNGLRKISESAIVFVHDGVRCMLTIDLIHRCYEQAERHGSAIPAIGSKDSVRIMAEEGSLSLQRDRIRLIQTPQTFRSEVLLPAYATDFRPEFTDEASVVEAQGSTVHLIAGEERNIKITSPDDLVLAEHYLKSDS